MLRATIKYPPSLKQLSAEILLFLVYPRKSRSTQLHVLDGRAVDHEPAPSSEPNDKKRYKGVTPSRLLEKMEEIGAQVAMGIFASNRAAGAGRQYRSGAAFSGKGEILVSAQETSCRGFMLERSTLQHITRTK